MQLVRGKALETLIAELKHSFDLPVRLRTRLAHIRASWPLTRMTDCGRGGVTGLHALPSSNVTSQNKTAEPCTLERKQIFLKIDAVLDARKFPLQIVKREPSAFDNEGWLFEVKHDGFRVLAIRDGVSMRLFTRNGYDISGRHQHLTAALAAVPAARFVLDGELVVLDDDGRSNFAKLARGRTGTHYYAFDLLMVGDADLRAKPLQLRKAMLADLLQVGAEPVRYCDHVIGKGKAFFDAVREAGLEGMVAKRRDSAYAGVLNEDWLKIKCLRVHDFVIGGWISDNNSQIGALLLGEFIDGALRYVGQVGSPSDSRVMRAVERLVRPRATSPFRDTVTASNAKFCEPAFRASVEFLDFTDDGYLRHPVFRRFADELFSKI